MQNSIQNTALKGNDGAHFLHATRTSVGGISRHTVWTKQKAFAFAVYEAALNISEPDMAAYRGEFTIEFVAGDAECDALLALAQGGFTA